MNHLSRAIPLAFLVLVVGAAAFSVWPGIPEVAAQTGATYSEGFESQAPGSTPSGAWFKTSETTVTGNFLVAATTLTGSTRAISFLDSAPNAGYGASLSTNQTGINLCNSPQSLGFDVYIPTGWSAGTGQVQFIVSGHTPLDAFQASTSTFVPGTPDSVMFTLFGGTGTTVQVAAEIHRHGTGYATVAPQDVVTMGAVNLGALYHAQISGIQGCHLSANAVPQTKFGMSFGTLPTTTVATSSNFGGVLNTLTVFEGSTAGISTTNPFYIDNFRVDGVPSVGHGKNFESFESFTQGQAPTRSFYTHTFTADSTTGDALLGVQPCLMPNKQPTSTAGQVPPWPSKCYVEPGGKTVFHITSNTFCSANIFSMTWAGIVPLATGGATYKLRFADSLTTPLNTIEIVVTTSGGGVTQTATIAVVRHSSLGAQTFTATNFPISYWWDTFHMQCDANGQLDTFAIYTDGGSATGYSGNSAPGTPFFDAPLQYLTVDATGTGAGAGTTELDDIDFPAAITYTHFVDTNNMNAMAVDYEGRTVITRQAADFVGEQGRVKTYAGGSLNPAGNIASGCNVAGGVGAFPGYVTYFDCSSGDGTTTNKLYIKSGTLGDPQPPGGSNCASEFTSGSFDGPFTTGGFELPTTLGYLGRIEDAEWDFSNHSPPTNPNFIGARAGQCTVSWSFTTRDGKVGVYTISRNTAVDPANPNKDGIAFKQYDPAGAPVLDLCSWRKHDVAGDARGFGSSFIAATSTNTGAGQWLVDSGQFVAMNGATNYDNTPVPTIADWYKQPGYTNSLSVACGEDHLAIMNPDASLTMVKATGTPNCVASQSPPQCAGEVIWQTQVAVDGSTLQRHNMAMSGDGKWLAYMVGLNGGGATASVTVLNATTGALLGTFPTETGFGTLTDIKTDLHGNFLWVGFKNRILIYDIHSVTTIVYAPIGGSGQNSCAAGCGPNGTSGGVTTTTTGGGVGAAGHAAGVAFGLNDAGGGLVMMFMYIIIFLSVGASVVPRKVAMLGGGVGAALGFGFSFYAGFVPGLLVFIMAFGAIGVMLFRFRGSAAAESE